MLIDHLLNTEWVDLKNKHIYCLDALGKFNIHRYMNLFSELGITHSVLIDKDDDEIQTIVNEFINTSKNTLTKSIDSLDPDLEEFLDIPKPNRPDRKPLNIMWHYLNDKIDKTKISELRKIIEKSI